MSRRLPCGADIRLQNDFVLALAVHRDRVLIAVGGARNLVQVWDLGTRALIRSLSRTAAGMITSLCLRRINGQLLLAAGFHDGGISIWDADNGAPIGTERLGHTGQVDGIALAPIDDAAALFSAGDTTVRRWKLGKNLLTKAAGPIPDILSGAVTRIAAGGEHGARRRVRLRP